MYLPTRTVIHCVNDNTKSLVQMLHGRWRKLQIIFVISLEEP